jgi:hypothetical protein
VASIWEDSIGLGVTADNLAPTGGVAIAAGGCALPGVTVAGVGLGAMTNSVLGAGLDTGGLIAVVGSRLRSKKPLSFKYHQGPTEPANTITATVSMVPADKEPVLRSPLCESFTITVSLSMPVRASPAFTGCLSGDRRLSISRNILLTTLTVNLRKK